MNLKHTLCWALALATSLTGLHAQDNYPTIDIPYTKYVLDNGLTLIVHEDHKAPIVAVNTWYHVGSKNENQGKTGFAHLFEHLMFNGSEHYNNDYFKVMDRIGATDLNGTTNNDRTNYFENVPVSALDMVLWMESDRMGYMLGAIDQAKLDEQRGVVQNEKRQGDNQPYALAEDLIVNSTFPKGHPYSWTVIGSLDDLNAASLDDVKGWFNTYYGAANAVVVLAGDITPAQALEKVKYYYGSIPSGPPVSKHSAWVAKMTGTHRQVAQDRVPQTKIQKIWNVPQWGTQEVTYIDLVSDILAAGKNSRLYKRLVYDEQLCTSIYCYLDPREISSQFYIDADVKEGGDKAKVERIIDEELAKFLANGPTEEELRRVKTQFFANKVKGLERIGGFGGKSDLLAMCMTYGGTPDYYKKTDQWVKDAKTSDIQKAAKDWLSDGQYILEINPFPEYTTTESKVDRSKLPELGAAPDVVFPDLQRATLPNGMKVILAQRKGLPVVRMSMMMDAGYASDQLGVAGLSDVAMNMLDEGSTSKTSLQISESLAMLGASVSTSSDLDMSYVSLSALQNNLDASMDIYSDVILNPAFPQAEFDRVKKEQLAGIQQEKSQPASMALRVMPKFLYGEGHAYSNPLTGSGTEQTVSDMKRDDVVKYHNTWFKPNNSTMVVVGDISMADLQAKLEKRFGNWKKADVPKKNLAEVKLNEKPVVYIMDKPDAAQSMIIAGHIAPSKNNPNEMAIQMMNNVLGGEFTSRINMNLREDKHWAYGAFTFMYDGKGQRPFMAYAPVQTDKTKESLVEMKKEMNDIITTRPPTDEEFNKTQSNNILSLPGQWETSNAVMSSIQEMVHYGYADDYWKKYAQSIRDVKNADAVKAAKMLVKPENMVWIVVGDRAKIEAGIKELGFGEVRYIDTNGNVIGKP